MTARWKIDAQSKVWGEGIALSPNLRQKLHKPTVWVFRKKLHYIGLIDEIFVQWLLIQ